MTRQFLPGFKTTFVVVGCSFVFLSLGLFAKGLIKSMAEFEVPDAVLNSPHYFDALRWVYVHMFVIGILIASIGYAVTDPQKQKWLAILLFLITLVYTYLDFTSSDSSLGNGLYKGEGSVAPAIISLVVNLVFLQLAVRMFAKRSQPLSQDRTTDH